MSAERAWIFASAYEGSGPLPELGRAHTVEAAATFVDWLIDDRGLPAENVYFCTDRPEVVRAGARGFPADSGGVLASLAELVTDGRNGTEVLFGYVSGHGFQYNPTGNAGAVELRETGFFASDFGKTLLEGAARSVDQLRRSLAHRLGGRVHVWFVDACRAQTNHQPAPWLSLPGPLATRGFAETGTLASTSASAPAFTASDFAPALIDALRGIGRAKVWRADRERYLVVFDSLQAYVASRVTRKNPTQEIDPDPPSREIVFTTLTQAQATSTLTVEVTGLDAGDPFDVELRLAHPGAAPRVEHALAPRAVLSVPPGDYSVRVLVGGVPLEASGASGYVDLYSDQALAYSAAGPESGDAALFAEPGELMADVLGPQALPPTERLTLVHLGTGLKRFLDSSAPAPIPAGGYAIAARGRRSRVTPSRVHVDPGTQRIEVAFTEWSEAHDAALATLGLTGTQFSETLGGALETDDLATWLLLFGASAVISRPGTFSKLSRLALPAFDHPAAETAILLLVTGEEQVEISADGEPPSVCVPLGPPGAPTRSALRIGTLAAEPGPHMLRVVREGVWDFSTPVSVLPGRVHILTVVGSVNERPRMRRFAPLSWWELENGNPGPDDRRQIDEAVALGDWHPLQLVAASGAIQEGMERPASNERLPDRGTALIEVLEAGRWHDPIMTAIAAWTSVRRGLDMGAMARWRATVGTAASRWPTPDLRVLLSSLDAATPLPSDPPAIASACDLWRASASGASLATADLAGPWTIVWT